jgi:hypothetical protein
VDRGKRGRDSDPGIQSLIGSLVRSLVRSLIGSLIPSLIFPPTGRLVAASEAASSRSHATKARAVGTPRARRACARQSPRGEPAAWQERCNRPPVPDRVAHRRQAAEWGGLVVLHALADARAAIGPVPDALAATGASSRPAMRMPRRWYVGTSNAA